MSSKEQSTQSDLSSWAIVAIGIGIVIYTHLEEIIQATTIILIFVFVALCVYGGVVWYRNRPKALEPLQEIKQPSPEPALLPKPQPTSEMQENKPFEMHIDYEAKQKHLLDIPVHSVGKLDWADQSFLRRNGYEAREFVPLGKIRRQKFLIIRQPPKNFEHTFLTYCIYDKLTAYGIEAEITHAQDLAILHKRDDYALCVVTPDDLRKHNHLSAKAKLLSNACGANWWFVVTQSAYAKSFHRYGDVLTRNQLDQWIHTTFSPNLSPLNTTPSHHTMPCARA